MIMGEPETNQTKLAHGNPSREPPPTFSPAVPQKHLALALWLLVFLAYCPVIANDFINYDDPPYVVENFHVQSAITWQSIKWAFCTSLNANWHPLTWLSHMLDFQIFRLRPWGHHLSSLLLHAANTCLIFLVLRRMTGAVWRSWFVAALFGLHPMHVESVAWVAERKDVLSGLFWMLTLWAYARYAQKPTNRSAPVLGRCDVQPTTAHKSLQRLESLDNPADQYGRAPIRVCEEGRPGKFLFLSLFFFACALMSKPMAVTLPFVLLLLDYWPLKRLQKENVWALLLEKLPFVLLAVILSVVTVAVQRAGGAIVSMSALPLIGRLENALVSYAAYLGKLLFPAGLAVFYPEPAHWPVGTILLGCFLFLVISVFCVVMYRRQPALLVGWLWFVGTLVPVIGLVQAGSQAMADRYSYIPSIGVFIALTWGICALIQGLPRQRIILSYGAAAAIVLCTALTWRQVLYWKNSGTLFSHAVAVTKNNISAYWNLGDYELKHGHPDEAIRVYQKAFNLQPNFAPISAQWGTALCKLDHVEQGISMIRLSLMMDPNSTLGHLDLADALSQEGSTNDAIFEYEQAIRQYPDYFPTYNRLGALLETAGRYDDEVALFEQAVQLYPAYTGAHVKLGQALSDKGQLDEAINQFREALKLEPGNIEAQVNLALALEMKK
jgi:Tfp pilus assembly protein PilF